MAWTEHRVGDSIVLDFAVTDEDGDPLDLTSATIRFALAKRDSATPAFTKSIGSGITVTDNAGGLFEVAIASADTESLAITTWKYEVEIITASGAVYTPDDMKGSVAMRDTIIKPAA